MLHTAENSVVLETPLTMSYELRE